MRFQKGFTIIELIVVVATIAVLASIVLTNVQGYMAKARDAKRVADINIIIKALEMYYSDHGSYPSTGGSLVCLGIPSTQQCWAGPYGSDSVNSALTPYLSQISKDPLPSRGFGAYTYRSPGNYWLVNWFNGAYSLSFVPDKYPVNSNSDCKGFTYGAWDEAPGGVHCSVDCRQCGFLKPSF